MRVGWLHDDPGYMGGAELTMEEFKASAPDHVEIVELSPGQRDHCDRWVVGNCQTYGAVHMPEGITFRYHHDVSTAPLDTLLFEARHIYCSPLQAERAAVDGEIIPPALDLDWYRQYADQNHRAGAVCIGRMAYGKGLEFLAEYPEPVDVYSSVPVISEGSVRYRGPAENVATTLSRYQRFVFLPTAIEPFGRAVVEAWAAGLELVINANVGARHWIEENPEGLETASEDFWRVVLA